MEEEAIGKGRGRQRREPPHVAVAVDLSEQSGRMEESGCQKRRGPRRSHCTSRLHYALSHIDLSHARIPFSSPVRSMYQSLLVSSHILLPVLCFLNFLGAASRNQLARPQPYAVKSNPLPVLLFICIT